MRWRETVDFEHDGSTMIVKRLGPEAGPQFVLVHGIGVASRYWTRLAGVLSRTGCVHVVELPGFGGTPKPEAPLSVEQLAAVVNAYVQEASVHRPVLIGHSMGAQVVVDAALQQPERVGCVVAIGTVVDPGARTAPRQGKRLAQDFLRETPPANWAVLRDYARTGPRWYAATVPVMLGYATEDAVTRLGVPLLLVRGGRDPICRRDWARQLQRLAPDARLVEIPGAAHVAMYTHPEEVAAEVLLHAGHVPRRPTS